MSNEIVPAASPQLLAAPPPPAHQRPPESPLVLIHRHLRGRYPVAIALGVVLAIPAAITGWYAMPPVYQSTGLVRVAPTLPKILFQNEDNQLLPMFDSFVSTQASFIQSRRVLDLASGSDELRNAGWPAPPEGTAALDKAMEVTAKRGGELITLTVKHRKPALAQAAVNAILKSYSLVEDELNGTRAEGRETALIQRAKELETELASQRSQIFQLSEEHGTDDLDQLRATRMNAIVRLESAIHELELTIAHAESENASEMGPPSPPSADGDLQALAERDKTLADLMDEREHLNLQCEGLSQRLTEKHTSIIDLRSRIQALDARIAARAATVHLASAPSGRDTIERAKNERDQLMSLHDSAVEDLKKLGRTRMNIVAMRERSEEIKKDLAETNARLDQMRVERQNTKSGRISIAQMGDLPVSPATDRRRPLAAFGGLAGLGAGLGIVWLAGFMRRGYRYVDDLSERQLATPVLGVIPDLGPERTDADEQAALSVHQIRSALQLRGESGDSRGRAVTVTSPMSGDGKTHLSLALAMSFATSGERTLLIDADLIGRSLSAQLNLSEAKGFGEAIRSEVLNGEVHNVRTNLWVIPAGKAASLRPEELSSALVRPLLERARREFDTVIIDTGPVMGSLEAAVASSLSDQVVMAVARGQSSTLVKEAIQRVRVIGGHCAGIVFNRAQPKDFLRSGSVLSASARRSRTSSTPPDRKAGDLARLLSEAGQQQRLP
jgi:Mrp family chromosome partitioning ATPase/uncharacterized protein involved in exopolysaccharide biosynthesis